MKPCPEEIIEYMHDYLDGDLNREKEETLKHHLQECSECQHHFHELKKAIAFVQSTSHISASADFTDKVMAGLPKEKKKSRGTEMVPSPPATDGCGPVPVLYDRKFPYLLE